MKRIRIMLCHMAELLVEGLSQPKTQMCCCYPIIWQLGLHSHVLSCSYSVENLDIDQLTSQNCLASERDTSKSK